MKRLTVDVAGTQTSYLAAGESGPVILMLHGTYWSRVWQPVMDDLARAGFRAIAVDFPGLGRSGGELTVEQASIPALGDWVVEFLRALRIDEPILLAGHDIGGGIAQHILVDEKIRVEKLALVESTTRFGGMENSSAIFFSEKIFAGRGKLEPLVAHEIAHQWFGDSVTEADWHHLWLSESFATYFSAAGGSTVRSTSENGPSAS